MNAKKFWEIFPGLTTWLSFLIPIVLSFFIPTAAAALFLVYTIYWLIKCLIMSWHLILGYFHYRKEIKIDWQWKLEEDFSDHWKSIYHLVIMPTYKEPVEVLDRAVGKLARSNYLLAKVIFVLAIEERAGEEAVKRAEELKKRYGHFFGRFFITRHPVNIKNEIIGKGANITYAAKELTKYILKEKIDPLRVVVTTLDSDNQVHPQYLACLTHRYIQNKDPRHTSFQPLPMYFNNIWQVPMPMRIVALGSSFWQMIESTRPRHLRNFSAHAQTLQTLIDVDYWSKVTIVEDGHQFWRTYFYYHGNHLVVPIFVPIYQDAVWAGNYRDTFREQYLQKKRWAWGVSDMPYVIMNTIKDKQLPRLYKWVNVGRLLEGHWAWATTSIFLVLIGWLPFLNHNFRTTIWAFNFPLIYSRLLTAAMLGMAITIIISTLLLPPRPKGHWPRMFVEWLLSPFLLPLTNIIFGSLPAIDSQTRLMLGKYLEYRVTVKK
ncbi:MAG: conserved membrane protein of unknown function [Candidatus Berkelbacteria bacterium Licking1014_2]|uniref:Uncharacterized protein n=1 Tax=Candidatus Berkelbacteria bacterium Licking1014_2 TaxID=2017146 RepID=A0A554LVY2_9BACT|nr:MAG: conserved membrane protein of unknown function [Candidatus Berkelbacteria bacterium Licking1014_2]